MRVKCWICGGKGHIPVYELFCAASETARACTNCGGKGIIDLEIIAELKNVFEDNSLASKFVKVTEENELELMQTLEALGCVWGQTKNLPTTFLPLSQGNCWDNGDPVYFSKSHTSDKILISGGFFTRYHKEITLDDLKDILKGVM